MGLQRYNTFDVSLATEREYPEFKKYKKLEALVNITGKNQLPSFSGHIKYDVCFSMTGENCLLDLGYVGESAAVYVNGIYVGEKTYPPYTFDLTGFAKRGENILSVIVANHLGYQVKDKFSRCLTFEPSGLLGPVTITKYNGELKSL